MRGVVKAWTWYAAGAVTVLLGIWLYSRRLFDVHADLLQADAQSHLRGRDS